MLNDPVFDVEARPTSRRLSSIAICFSSDCALRDGAAAAGVDAAGETLADFGAACGGAEAMEHGRLANEFPPRLRLVDPRGNRLDEVEFHPAYHALMARSMAAGLHCSIWDERARRRWRRPAMRRAPRGCSWRRKPRAAISAR